MKNITVCVFAAALWQPFLHANEGAASLSGTDTDGTPKVMSGTPVEALRLLPNFYQTPHMPFILSPGEQVVPVSIKGSYTHGCIQSARRPKSA